MDMLAEKKMIQELSKNMLVDGFPLVMDLEKSHDNVIYDSITNSEYIDFFTGFGSIPIAYNHLKLKNKEFIEQIGRGALVKVANSDIYTKDFIESVIAFRDFVVPEYLKYIFFIDGGALAVENALKVAFDWKLKKRSKKGISDKETLKIIHFKEAFHGRSGYTLSLTNTDPIKVSGFPKFEWPRIDNPKAIFPIEENLVIIEEKEKQALDQIEMIVKRESEDIAAIIIEPIQCEGGDNHFRREFLQKLQLIALKNDILFIVDEVQTGMCATGKIWAHQHFDLKPDIVCFGKKTQVCGILAGKRIDEVDNHVFCLSSRISSTWGGNIVDFIRLKQYIAIIKEENLLKNAELQGEYLLKRLINLQKRFPTIISNTRGLGLLLALDLPNYEIRNKVLNMLFSKKIIFVACGKKSIRFRPALDVTKEQIDIVISKWEEVLEEVNIDNKKSVAL
jgi:L-lysine 6-transaminase